ncbi:TetR/AcrR family transcriptional regulator [Actinomadura sp. WMMA1423]|uniref:TetR/AcrR family transcriptional regulator n=1 Tax=Actinomadura sp. WMMA1423 TaxID=2591108 RepID=UPI001147A818|nr:TetR/AcrR family transcriptional regulator [Actinomadura sp. WMMA1423]
MTNIDEPGTEQLLNVAAKLLSGLGYDSVTNTMIAEASGIDLAVVTERYGGKRDIYMAVLRRAHRRRIERIRALDAVYTPDLNGLTRLLDEYLDLCMETPELGALWMQRWLSDADDIPGLDTMFGGPELGRTIEMVRKAIADDLDAGMVMRTLTYTILAFSQKGIVDTSAVRHEPTDPATLKRFRAHLHQLARHLVV